MIEVHHLKYSQSFRIVWLMEELGLEYKLKSYDRDPASLLAPAEYKKLSPLGTAPVIVDGDLILSETNAVVDYILDKYSGGEKFRPDSKSSNRSRYLFWYNAGQSSLMPLLLILTIFTTILRRCPFFLRHFFKTIFAGVSSKFINPRISSLLKLAEEDLASDPWFAGSELSGADIALCYTMDALEARGYLSSYPQCQQWLSRVRARPAFQAALEKTGDSQVILKI